MLYEKSSGGIVYRKNGNKIEVLFLEWLNSKGQVDLVIPKGKIEGEEIARETALREIGEETSLKVEELEVIKFITKINYTYTAGYLESNPVINKDVYIFLIKYNGTLDPIVREEERFTGFKWIPIDDLKDVKIKFDLNSIIYKNRTYFI